ncbi:MAG: hypothetical protein FGM32_00760 [Candidatus Kapabacteria bacterium]|nr:hypothetical protein [Candidatus Kapabacteria bacterium]
MLRFRYVIGLLILLSGPTLLAQSARSYVSGSARIACPSGPLADSTGLSSAVQFDLRYIWSPSRTVLLGIGGSWMTPSTGNAPRPTVAPGPLSITQITATATWRPLKHGWSPFVGGEVGFGFLSPPDSLTAASVFATTLGAAYGLHLGTFIPLSDRLDFSISGRWMTLATSNQLNLLLVSAELVYRIQ